MYGVTCKRKLVRECSSRGFSKAGETQAAVNINSTTSTVYVYVQYMYILKLHLSNILYEQVENKMRKIHLGTFEVFQIKQVVAKLLQNYSRSVPWSHMGVKNAKLSCQSHFGDIISNFETSPATVLCPWIKSAYNCICGNENMQFSTNKC